MRIAPIAFAILLLSPVAQASNTAPSRSFTTDWLCDNGRILRFNAHPRRPEGAAQLTYIGSRVEVTPTPTVSGSRYVSKDGKVAWHSNGDEGQLTLIRCCPNRSLADLRSRLTVLMAKHNQKNNCLLSHE